MKNCIKCNIEKEETEFYKRGRDNMCYSYCKECTKIIKNENYYKNKELRCQYAKTYYNANKESIFEKEKERYKNDVNFRLSKIYRNRLNSYIKGEKDNMNYLHCDLDFFKIFVEAQFIEGMNWENKYNLWELDHVIPVSKFNLELSDHKNICFHWCNYKPIMKHENKKKFNKLVDLSIKTHSEYCKDIAHKNNKHYIDIYI